MAPADMSGNRTGGSATGSQFLTVAEVAALMRVSKMTVYRLVHNGELPAMRVGRSLNFDPRTEQIIGDEQANRLRSEALREPWRI